MNTPERSAALLDRCLKVLTRRAYPAVFRLLGAEVDPARVRFENVALNLPEHQADDLLVVDTPHRRDRWALMLERQTRPDPKQLLSWRFKAAAASLTLRCPVILAVLYLERGRYATFPDREEIHCGGLRNTYEFEAVCLWEHTERIVRGDLPELAPLLLLASEKRTEAVLQQERRLILDLPVTPEQRRDLLAVAMMVGRRYFTAETLRRIFQEELAMLKEADFIEEWVEEGETRATRIALSRVLTARFGLLSSDVQARLEEFSKEQCLELLDRVVSVSSLSELGF